MFQFAQRFRERLAMNLRDTRHCDKFLLWIDAVGGFWVCLADEWCWAGRSSREAAPTCPSWPTSPPGTHASAATAKAM